MKLIFLNPEFSKRGIQPSSKRIIHNSQINNGDTKVTDLIYLVLSIVFLVYVIQEDNILILAGLFFILLIIHSVLPTYSNIKQYFK